MVKNYYRGAASRSLLFLIVAVFIAACTGCSRISDVEKRITYDSLMLIQGDDTQRFAREKQLFSDKAKWQQLVADTTGIKARVLTELEKNYMASEDYYKTVIAGKNGMIFSSNRKLITATTRKPDVGLLIAIVLITGILGGVAGPRFALLDTSTAKTIDKAKEKIEESKKQTETLKNTAGGAAALKADPTLQAAVDNSQQAITGLEQVADDLKQEAERKGAFLLFGLIAAALSFVALNLFNSKILDFASEIDYFIFAGYCLLGAVFAKNWIVQLYDAISKKKDG